MPHQGQTVPRDRNYVAALVATDSSDSSKTVAVAGDVITGRLLVSAVITSGGGAGTQYADGDARGTATGTLQMIDDGTNIQAAVGNSSGEQIVQAKQNGTWNVATVTALTGITNTVTITATNLSTNIAQINGITPLMGNGTTGTGSLRVTIASDNTAFAVNATLSAETTKVIGVVRNSDGAGNLWTSNSTTYAAKFAQDSNLLGTLGTAFSTAGKVDVKAADGDVFVRQTTAANLNATVIGTGTFVTQSTLAAETTKVIGVTRTADGSGNLLTSTSNALDVNLKSSGLSNQSVNLAQLAATTTDTNSGNKSAGTLRVVLATDQPALTNKLLVTPDSVALPANQSVNISQMNGVTVSMGVGATGTGVQRVVVANDAGRTLLSTGGSAASSGNNTLVTAGTNKLKVYAFSLSTTSTTAMTCIFQSGASGTELWRVIIQAVTGTSAGANLVVQPPAWLFATASATLLNLNLSSANAVHWAVSYWDEA